MTKQVREVGYININSYKYNAYVETKDIQQIADELKLQVSCYNICNKFILSKVHIL